MERGVADMRQNERGIEFVRARDASTAGWRKGEPMPFVG